jgi:hypothetical protein
MTVIEHPSNDLIQRPLVSFRFMLCHLLQSLRHIPPWSQVHVTIHSSASLLLSAETRGPTAKYINCNHVTQDFGILRKEAIDGLLCLYFSRSKSGVIHHLSVYVRQKPTRSTSARSVNRGRRISVNQHHSMHRR